MGLSQWKETAKILTLNKCSCTGLPLPELGQHQMCNPEHCRKNNTHIEQTYQLQHRITSCWFGLHGRDEVSFEYETDPCHNSSPCTVKASVTLSNTDLKQCRQTTQHIPTTDQIFSSGMTLGWST